MNITMRDVAKKANVSVSTVSRVLNNKPTDIPISQTTRQRVLQAIEETGYRPNIAARHLVNKKSFNLIGVILPADVPDLLSHPFYMTLVRGIARLCQQENYTVSIYFIDTNKAGDVEQNYQHILEIPTTGYILSTTHIDDYLLPRFINDNVPFVHIGRMGVENRHQAYHVDVDNYLGGCLAVEHLLSRGHRKIGMIAATATLFAGAERRRGYDETMQRAGIVPDPSWIISSDFWEVGGRTAMEKLLDSDNPPTAVFTASDSIAIGAIEAVQARGLRIPTDIAIVGFDDTPDAARTKPPLTTIRQPIFKLGESAAKLLLEILNKNNHPANILLQPELIIRGST